MRAVACRAGESRLYQRNCARATPNFYAVPLLRGRSDSTGVGVRFVGGGEKGAVDSSAITSNTL